MQSSCDVLVVCLYGALGTVWMDGRRRSGVAAHLPGAGLEMRVDVRDPTRIS